MNFTDRIRPTDKGITTYLDELENLDYQIPAFQRDVVWEKENVKKLWDSIYKFYPLGSILVWKKDIKLQNHRKITPKPATTVREKLCGLMGGQMLSYWSPHSNKRMQSDQTTRCARSLAADAKR